MTNTNTLEVYISETLELSLSTQKKKRYIHHVVFLGYDE
jgi:hypothetical protein